MFGASKQSRAFKDYCLILQVHPEADAAMIDAAYWHLAKRYNQAASYDPEARAKIEELNEAYIVLGSAHRREEYMKRRTEVMGEGALPVPPRPPPAKPPLSVMARQRPEERAQAVLHERTRRMPAKRIAVGITVSVGIGGIALSAIVSPLLAVGVATVLFGAVLALMVIEAALPALTDRVSMSRAARTATVGKHAKVQRGEAEKLDDIKAQAVRLREAPDPIDAPIDVATPIREPEEPAELLNNVQALPGGESERSQAAATPASQHESAGMSRGQIEHIKKQAAAIRRGSDVQPTETQGETADADPEEADKIRAQTERLKAIAEKFNAARAQSAAEPAKREEPE